MKLKSFHIIVLTFLMVIATNSFGQTNDLFSYIEKYNLRLDSIRNYAASFTVKTDIQSLELPDATGKIFYKWPAHYSISTYSYTVLPKKKLTPFVRYLNRAEYKVLGRGKEQVQDFTCKVIDLFPKDSISNIDHFTLWVDAKNYLVRRVLILERNGSEFVYHYSYKKNSDLLPSKLVYTFEFYSDQPKSIAFNPLSISTIPEESKEIKGSLIIDFNYTEIRREGEQF